MEQPNISTPPQTNLPPKPETNPVIPSPIPKFSPPLIATFVLLVVISALGGFFLGKSLSQPKTPSLPSISQLSPTPTQPIPTPTPDPTANWKTYESLEGNYQIKYPETWNFIEVSEGSGPLFSPAKKEEIFTSSWLTICTPDTRTPENLAKDSAATKTLLQKETIEIGGKKGIKQILIERLENNKYKYSTEIFIGGVKYKNLTAIGTLPIYIYNLEGVYPSKYQKVFDLILSTFKFLD